MLSVAPRSSASPPPRGCGQTRSPPSTTSSASSSWPSGAPPLIGLIAGLALALLLVPGLAGITRALTAEHDDALLSLSASFVLYFAAAFAVTELGHFPVPVMGTGAGHILGWYSASGILAALVWPRDTRVPIVART